MPRYLQVTRHATGLSAHAFMSVQPPSSRNVKSSSPPSGTRTRVLVDRLPIPYCASRRYKATDLKIQLKVRPLIYSAILHFALCTIDAILREDFTLVRHAHSSLPFGIHARSSLLQSRRIR